MDIQPFLDAPLAVQIHAVSALEALLLGPYLLYQRQRSRLHRVLGYIWVTNMALAILSSWFIHGIRIVGPFGPIHILSAFATVSLFQAVRHARNGNYEAHRGNMRGLFFGGLVAAGVLAFMPGRVMNRMLFPHALENEGFIVVATLAAVCTTAILLGGRLRRTGRNPQTPPLRLGIADDNPRSKYKGTAEDHL